MSQRHAHPTGLEAYRPQEIAKRIEDAGVAKTELALPQLLALSVLAGAFIGFGAAFYTLVMTGADAGFGPHRLLGGIAFSLGLVLVIVGGAELFTGNALIVMAWVDGRVSTMAVLRNWTYVLVGNLIGALAMALLFQSSGLHVNAYGATAVRLAETKAMLPLDQGLVRGILCNALVCLAVWLTFAARDVTGKVLAIVWPISAFVALGLEHSIANMYLLPAGMLAGAQIGLGQLVGNLVVVTLGNVVGGAGGVALAYAFAYGKRAGICSTGDADAVAKPEPH